MPALLCWMSLQPAAIAVLLLPLLLLLLWRLLPLRCLLLLLLWRLLLLRCLLLLPLSCLDQLLTRPQEVGCMPKESMQPLPRVVINLWHRI